MMKRKFLTVFCAAALTAAMLSGCGDGGSGNETEENTAAEETEETAETAETEETQEDTSEPEMATEEETEAAGFTDGSDGDAETGEASEETEDTEDTEDTEIEDVTEDAEGEDTEAESAGTEDGAEDAVMLDTSESLSGIHHAEIVVQDYGTIEVELDADTAPLTVTNFVKLAQENFYDGLTFHRIMDGFMIQGGDPLGNGTGGSEETITGEFASNDIDNDISHVRGVISMARSSDPDSASSQFFIVQTDSTFLDGEYAAFGEVTAGMEIVDDICKDAEPVDGNGTIPSDEQPVIETIRILDCSSKNETDRLSDGPPINQSVRFSYRSPVSRS